MDSNEYKTKKEEVANKIDDLLKSYDELSKMISPKHWRTSGSHFGELKRMKENLNNFTEITPKELDTEWVREAINQ